MADVFISYKREDREWAARVDAALREAGYSTWWDTSLVAGEHFNEAIDRELKAAECVVVLWSKTAAASRWVNAEAVSGFDRGILVSCRLDSVDLTYPFSVVQTANLPQEGAEAVVVGVRQKIGKGIKTAVNSGVSRQVTQVAEEQGSVDSKVHRLLEDYCESVARWKELNSTAHGALIFSQFVFSGLFMMLLDYLWTESVADVLAARFASAEGMGALVATALKLAAGFAGFLAYIAVSDRIVLGLLPKIALMDVHDVNRSLRAMAKAGGVQTFVLVAHEKLESYGIAAPLSADRERLTKIDPLLLFHSYSQSTQNWLTGVWLVWVILGFSYGSDIISLIVG